MWRKIAALSVAALFVSTPGVLAQIYAPQSVERDFRLDWQVTRGKKGPVIEGYVYNMALRSAERMGLQIERLDGTGQVVGNSTARVLGVVPMNGRAYFSTSVPEAVSYRVEVVTFDWGCGGSGGGGGGM